ncbi:hypothetical protein EDD66_102421 [Mobilisporobacter senegalensis]|uniref:Flagellar motility protein MotE (MotC chaperone) n=1 Tax=Mobilisporobacter senegalensis TaxID=1329262 RepID=A0A3N1XVZ3_9FIRM|nr:hypothetical protein [Mobilisporobacter senegalensis]ROR30766.1 hypothetical protein EDD66_102421 [Mobilisporobacter senegalensis]
MAKKNKRDQQFDGLDREKESFGSKIITSLIILAIVLIWLGVFALLIKFDVGGFGSTVLRPVLKDIPVINRVLPSVPDEQLAEENDYPYKNYSEAVQVIKKLEKELDSMKQSESEEGSSVAQLQAEIDRLKVFEENQLEYEKKLKEFETEVVFNEKAPEITEYQKYYESIDPTHAEELYKQVIQQMQVDEEIKNQAKQYSTMKPEEAAPILEVMTGDLDLVCKILRSMKPKESGAILAKMDSAIAARITKKMSLME